MFHHTERKFANAIADPARIGVVGLLTDVHSPTTVAGRGGDHHPGWRP
jgi:hypothetical protein